jgi:hypothetical protein
MMKKQQLREKTLVDIKKSKQSTFNDLPKWESTTSNSETKKAIAIAQLGYVIKENELELLIAFRLLPSKSSFSNIALELFFDDNQLNTYLISVPPSQLLGDELNFPVTLDMNGICPGSHTIKVEMCERIKAGEKLACASKYVVIEYSPTRKEDRYIKIPIVRKIDGSFRIILPEEQDIYRDLERSQHEELKSKRDQW